MKKPELLMPAGNVEALHAALEGGADAIYLGMKEFNARGRAFNFSPHQLVEIIEKAHQQKAKIYITLNTLIKNKELPKLLDTLHFLEKIQVDAVIIQDWGVYNLIHRYFKKLSIHASTQMGNHNSLGTCFSKKKSIERIILARELSMDEMQKISSKSPVELEIFIHGALCYSFSGMCLFSSFLGGQSANRGLCKQPCRRMYQSEENKDYIFNLKDNQQLQQISFFKQNGIRSLKVEGRLKSAEYVYRVAKAYRLAIDEPERIQEAEALLNLDLGREKTAYFLGGNVKQAISDDTYTGKPLGAIQSLSDSHILFHSDIDIKIGNRLRIKPRKAKEGMPFKVEKVEKQQNELYHISGKIPQEAKKGDQIYLTDFRDQKFPSKLNTDQTILPERINPKYKQKILDSNRSKGQNARSEELFIRVDSIAWMKKIFLPNINGLILNLSKAEWKEFNPQVKFLQKNRHKIIIELPKFIPEGSISFYRDLIQQLSRAGFKRFSLSHLSQKEMVSKELELMSNENVYTMNDASITFLKHEGIDDFIFPLENEFDNLKASVHKDGIVPVYFYPALFYSRMPVKANDFTSDKKEDFHKIVRDGITNIYPDIPVSLLQYTDKLRAAGFKRFLIDLSFEKPSGNRLETLIKRLRKSAQVQPSSNFNFTKGLE